MRSIFTFFFIISCVSAFAQIKQKPLKHVVTITFSSNATEAQIQEVDRSFMSLKKLKVVQAYEWGVAVNQKDQSIKQHVYVFTFNSLEDMDTYAKSKEHQAHIQVGADITAGVSAVDYFEEK